MRRSLENRGVAAMNKAPLESYLENADKLAQDVVNAWGLNVTAGNAELLTPEFKALVDKTFLYRTLKQVADNHRDFGVLTEREGAEEQAARCTFAEAYKDFYEERVS